MQLTLSAWDGDMLCDIIQTAPYTIEIWCKEQFHAINPNKTQMVLLTKKRVKYASTPVKYLDDSRLTWNSHMKNWIKIANITHKQWNRTIGCTWGLSTKATMWIYMAIKTTTIHKLNQMYITAYFVITEAINPLHSRHWRSYYVLLFFTYLGDSCYGNGTPLHCWYWTFCKSRLS